MGVKAGSVALAAQRRPEKQFAAIWDAFYELDASVGRGEASVASDFQLHRRIAEATCIPPFDDFMKFLGPVVIPRQTVHVQLRPPHEQVLHLQMLQSEDHKGFGAIERQDVSAAGEAM